MSNEPSGLLEKHIEKMNIEYPIAKTKGEDADRIYGVKGFPSSYLVGPDGRVIWEGHPGSLSESDIESALESTAFVAPIPDGDKKLNKLIAAQDFGAALKAIDKGLAANGDDAGLKAARDAVQGLLERKLEAANKAAQEGDFGNAMAIYEELQVLFKGDQAAKDAKTSAKELSKNPDAKEELAAWKKMAKGDKACFEGDFEKAGKIYAGVAKKHEGTKSAQRAQEFLTRHRM